MKTIQSWFYGHSRLVAGIVGVFVVFVAAGSASGQTIVPAPKNVITSSTNVVNLFCIALLWMFWGLIVLAVAMFLVGGYIYATSRGEPERVSQATKTLTYAAIAIVVALVAKGVPLIIGSFLKVPASQLGACGG